MVKYKFVGPGAKKEITNAQFVKAMCKLNGKEIFPNIILPKLPKEYQPRLNAKIPHKQEEKKLQREIISHLRDYGCFAGKVKAEAGIFMGRRLKNNLNFVGVPDILCFHPKTGQTWIEVKWGNNKLREPDQTKFRDLCVEAGVRHITARSIEDIRNIYT